MAFESIRLEIARLDSLESHICPLCECGHGTETVEHFLLECQNHKEVRKRLRNKVGFGRMKVAKLLGDIKILEHTLEYIKATKRMEV